MCGNVSNESAYYVIREVLSIFVIYYTYTYTCIIYIDSIDHTIRYIFICKYGVPSPVILLIHNLAEAVGRNCKDHPRARSADICKMTSAQLEPLRFIREERYEQRARNKGIIMIIRHDRYTSAHSLTPSTHLPADLIRLQPGISFSSKSSPRIQHRQIDRGKRQKKKKKRERKKFRADLLLPLELLVYSMELIEISDEITTSSHFSIQFRRANHNTENTSRI